MAWLDELLDITAEVETPKSFILWAGLTAIAAVARRKVYLDKHYYKLYPNIYVLLVARSGLRKTFAVNSIAKALVEGVGTTRVIAGRNSIQGILAELSTSKSFSDGRAPITEAHAFLCSGEFSNLIINDPSSLTILTDLYDSHYNPEWDNILKSGKEKLKNVCVTMLGASNEAHLKDRINEIDIEGGFVARTLLIVEDKKALINPLTDAPKIVFDLPKLIPYLKSIDGVQGGFKWTPDGKKRYEDWYKEYSKETRDDKTGTAERLNDHILKVSMLFSLARDLSLELMDVDIDMAIQLCEQFTSSVRRITAGSGKSTLARPTALVLNLMLNSPNYQISRQKILRKFYGEFSSLELDHVIQTLTESGAVRAMKSGGDIVYAMDQKCVEEYLGYKKAKERA